MASPTKFEDYKDKYEHIKFTRTEEGIVTIHMTTDGGTLKWFGVSHDELAWAFADVAGDTDAEVVILTGAGEDFINNFNYGTVQLGAGELPTAELMERKAWGGYQLIHNFLEIQVPVVAAVNGPCCIHSELPIMADVVIASDDAWFEDRPHFPMGVVPGDGMHIVWPLIVGQNRARYFLTTDMRLSAQEAKEWGAVNEVVPKAQVYDRAMELAQKIAHKPPMTRRHTHHLLTQPLRKAMVAELSHGLGLELYAQRGFWPKGNQAMTRSWKSEDPFAE
jgi:enoyl-CoA hydratase/carnithine racemase